MPDTFTPEQISQILEEFFRVVGTRQYIGARYVPIFGRKDEASIEWDNTGEYEPLTIVLYQGNSYTSRQFVPVGVEITNQEFWAITGNYNAQVEQYRRDTLAAKATAEEALTIANQAQEDVDTLLPKADFSAENTVKDYVDAIATNAAKIIGNNFSPTHSISDFENETNATLDGFDGDNTVKDYIDAIPLRKDPGRIGDTIDRQDYGINTGPVLINANSHGMPDQSSNTGLALRTNANGEPSHINIGQGRTQAAADVVSFGNYINDVPYTYIIPQNNIQAFTTHSVTFVNASITAPLQVGMVLWVGDDINRAVYDAQENTPLRRYYDYFVAPVYAGIITAINDNVVTVNNWQLLPYVDNTSPAAGNYTPVFANIYVNPCTGIYSQYDIVNVADSDTIPDGYKAYVRQCHLYDKRETGMYTTGELMALHNSKKFRAAYYADTVDGAHVGAFYMSHGDGDWILARAGAQYADWPYIMAGFSNNGLLAQNARYADSDESVIEALEQFYGIIRLETGSQVSENNIPLSKLVYNAQYTFEDASAKINIINDTGASVLYQLSNSATRGTLAIDGKIVITRTGNGQIMIPVLFTSSRQKILHITVNTGINIAVE